jgi:hypothetical protein
MLARLRQAPTGALVFLLVVWTGVVSLTAYRRSFREVGWPDEAIYLAGARNLAERGTLQTNFYLAHSILLRGHPHRDVHMPGYILALAPFVRVFGDTMAAAAILNGLALIGCAVLLFVIGRRLTGSREAALVTAALLPLLPPFPGYVAVAYSEIVVTLAFLAGIAWLARDGGGVHAAAAGVLFVLGGVFRETLWIALPVYFLRLPRRWFWRAFLPAAALTFAAVIVPLSRDRAIHPNALYPGVLMEAQRSADPIRTFITVLVSNVGTNVRLALESAPFSRAEDGVLLFLAALAAASLLAWGVLSKEARAWAVGVWLSLAFLTVAVFVLYVVRERGGVWGGVRAYMTWAPLLLLLVVTRAAAWRPAVRWPVLGLALLLFIGLDRWQIYWFGRYKGSDYEDQDRNARYLERYIAAAHPHRIVSRSFVYGHRHYPIEVVWGLPQDADELAKLEQAIDYEFLSIHEKHALRPHLVQNPRYERVNKDDRGAEFLIWRRVY